MALSISADCHTMDAASRDVNDVLSNTLSVGLFEREGCDAGHKSIQRSFRLRGCTVVAGGSVNTRAPEDGARRRCWC